MARFISVDVEAHQIGVTFDYSGDWEVVKKLVDDKLGEQVTLQELSRVISEIDDEIN